MTKTELVKLIIDEFGDKETKMIYLSELDFGDMSICLNCLKARIILNEQQEATYKISNNFQVAKIIQNERQEATESISNDSQRSEYEISNNNQRKNNLKGKA